ncbi:MAG: TlpA disulfide reductase family protein [Bacteroidota bacterium]
MNANPLLSASLRSASIGGGLGLGVLLVTLFVGCDPAPPPIGSQYSPALLETTRPPEAVARGWAVDADTLAPQPAPSLALRTLAGPTLDLERLRGQVVVINFWATWCPPCRIEMPILQAIHEEYAQRPLHVMGVALNEGGASEVAPFIQEQGTTYTIALDSLGLAAEAFGGVLGLPATFLIDHEGHIVYRQLGLFDEARFRADVDRHVRNALAANP